MLMFSGAFCVPLVMAGHLSVIGVVSLVLYRSKHCAETPVKCVSLSVQLFLVPQFVVCLLLSLKICRVYAL